MMDINKHYKILFLSPVLPYPLDDGMKIRSFHTINQLLKKGYEVTVICFLNGKKDKHNLEILRKVLNIDIRGINIKISLNSLNRIFYSFFSKYPFYMKLYYRKNYNMQLNELLSTLNFDLVYVFNSTMCLYAADLEMPKILDSVDSQSRGWLGGFKSTKNIVHKLYWYTDYIKAKRIEKQDYVKYDYVITAAERDAEYLKKLTNVNLCSVPNGVDMSYFKPENIEPIHNSITFVGTMDAFSNQQAVIYFINEIYPGVKKAIPSVKVFIVGKKTPDNILELHDGINIFVMGYVENISSFIDKSEIIISPLKMATGIQNKILEAMAMNKPIVATRESLGEINKFVNEKDIIIANDKEEFTVKLIELLNDKSKLDTFGKNGRDIVNKHYSWESLGYKIDEIIKNVLSNRN